MSLNTVSLWLRNFQASGCCSTIFLCKADETWCPSCFLTSVTNWDSQKLRVIEIFWTLLRFVRNGPILLCPPLRKHSHRPGIVLFSVCSHKPFNNTTISSSLQVGHLNRVQGSWVVFAFFLGNWNLLNRGLDSPVQPFWGILKMSNTTTSSCYHRL